MIKIMNFSSYLYMPMIRTRASELLAIENLSEDTKGKILPFISLSKANRVSSAYAAFEKWNSAFSAPAIIGLSGSQHLIVDEYNDLILPDNDFSNWDNFIGKVKQANDDIIPSLILNSNVGKRDFVKQLQKLESNYGSIALKVNPLSRRDIAASVTAASVASSIDNIIFILDVGQINIEQQKAALDATIQALNELRTIDGRIEIVTTSTSFPRMFQSYTKNHDETYGEIPMLEWENYHAIGGQEVAIYGDYAGIHGEFYQGSYAKFVARVDYPTPGTWIFERRKQQAQKEEERELLYSLAAQAIITSESWDDSLDVWGSRIIKKAAKNDLIKFGSPGKWISVRMNLHIERVIRFLEDGITIPEVQQEDEWEDSDNW